jgi:PST family polysaccharide transporter
MVAAAVASEAVLAAVALATAYRATGASWSAWRFRLERARELLAESWPLMLSGLAIMLYIRTDQVMLTLMRGEHENGIYAAAQRLSEVLYFIPSALTVAANPALLRSHQASGAEYERRLTRLFSILVWIAIIVALPVALLSGWITRTLFGEAFRASGPVLALHVWAAPAVFLGVAQSNWFIAHGRQRGLLIRTVVGAFANILLNLFLIPRYGAMGAATATLLSQIVASILLNAMLPSTRGLFRMQCRALLPWMPR